MIIPKYTKKNYAQNSNWLSLKRHWSQDMCSMKSGPQQEMHHYHRWLKRKHTRMDAHDETKHMEFNESQLQWLKPG